MAEQNEQCNEIKSWDEINGLHPNILRGIYGNGFENPSPIQQKAIAPLINKKDIIAQAQSGTGKTGCFGIGVISLIDPNLPDVQGIILAPTRELAIQINDVITRLSVHVKKFKTQTLIGGTSSAIDKIDLEKNNPQLYKL